MKAKKRLVSCTKLKNEDAAFDSIERGADGNCCDAGCLAALASILTLRAEDVAGRAEDVDGR